jgi:endonuclease/exonuclease/phosphatase family metal-dependent hydrolase
VILPLQCAILPHLILVYLRNEVTFLNRNVSFLTWNIYFGTILSPLVGTTPEELPQRVTEVFRLFQATNFPVRAGAIADQIARKKPDIIGLQEAAIWQLLLPQNSEVAVEYDFVSILLKELKKRGLHYEVLAIVDTTDVTLPSSTGFNVRFVDRDAILVRKNSGLTFSNIETENFDAFLTVPVGGKPEKLLFGFISVDVGIFGKKFRLVNTHLQPAADPVTLQIQLAQADELLKGPGDTNLPLVFIGDFNSNSDGSGPTYNKLISEGGFTDTWEIAGKGDGFTCCQDADVLNLISQLFVRIDLILFRGDFKVKKVDVVGEKQEDRTPTALWPSDHAGVFGSLHLEDHHDHHHDESSDESSEHHHHHPPHKRKP